MHVHNAYQPKHQSLIVSCEKKKLRTFITWVSNIMCDVKDELHNLTVDMLQ